jgi:hypothetical protein
MTPPRAATARIWSSLLLRSMSSYRRALLCDDLGEPH